MNTLKTLVLISAIIISLERAHAQSDNSFASQRALIFADSLLKSFQQSDLDLYTDLSYPGIVQYYGGKKNFEEYLRRTKAINTAESHEQVSIIQLVNNTNEWQCVIQKTRESIVDNRKAIITTYMVGQSVDRGQSWKFFDVAFNSTDNIVYIMPDIFTELVIPQRGVVFAHTTIPATNQQLPIQQARL